MVNTRDMTSKDNTLEVIKEKFKKGVIDLYRQFLIDKDLDKFGHKSYQICSTVSDEVSTPRWAILSRKNLFGLGAEIDYTDQNRLKLTANPGRFRIECPPITFVNKIDVSDILERSEESQYDEVTQFFDMNNRQVFEKFGIRTSDSDQMIFLANCVLLDSLLHNRYSELKDVFCHNIPRTNY